MPSLTRPASDGAPRALTVLRLEAAQADGTSALADRDEIARVFDRLSIEHRTIVVLHTTSD